MSDALRALLAAHPVELRCGRTHLGQHCGAVLRIPVRALGQFDLRCPGCGRNLKQEVFAQMRADLDELKRLAKRFLDPEIDAMSVEILTGKEGGEPEVVTFQDLKRVAGQE